MTPDKESEQVKTTGSLLFTQPLRFGGRSSEPVMVGGVRSMFTLVSVKLAVLPARSAQEPVTDCPWPSPNVVGPDTASEPERVSVHVKLTVTATLFQPLALGWTDL